MSLDVIICRNISFVGCILIVAVTEKFKLLRNIHLSEVYNCFATEETAPIEFRRRLTPHAPPSPKLPMLCERLFKSPWMVVAACWADKCHNPTKCHSRRQMSQQPSTNVTANDKCHNIASTNVTASDKCHNFASTNVTANDKCHNFAPTNVTANDKCHTITMTTNDKCHKLSTNVSRHITWRGWVTLSLVGCGLLYTWSDTHNIFPDVKTVEPHRTDHSSLQKKTFKTRSVILGLLNFRSVRNKLSGHHCRFYNW